MPVQTDTIIQFSGLKSGVYDYHFTLGKEFFERFENEDLRGGDVRFDLRLERKERLLLFHISFAGTVLTRCDRCLDDLELPVEGEELLTVQIVNSDKAGECDDENVVLLSDKECQIDLSQWLYEYVVVAMPMQCLHPDDETGNPTCNPDMLRLIGQHLTGEEQRSGTSESDEEAIDPRWAKLMELRTAGESDNKNEKIIIKNK